ncbi:30S ribosomal protein S24e [Methanobacterium paludis]|jgi:small subunit ribosomal protein S24e|uniref:Small ribosomal subunit protein eS24 n=1 Tax=Methanobacterium paludis (strain DSM 25820 / JCM 18151 / SWAN1) TaxID=868131 RepID=F6D3X2_METPW|nr:30S ribosomal protein S24e [Methanobacterium paludis]AEG18774.1 30S ribosomal protein S24e [Methanobacterium paludis]
MDINVNEKIENPLLNRTEIHFDCIYQGEATPKILDVKNRLVALLDVDKNLLVVDKVKPSYGEGKADGYAKLYDSEESLAKIEKEHVLAKNKEPEKETKEEA